MNSTAFVRMNELLECILIIIQAGFPLERVGRRDGGRGREDKRGMNKKLSSWGTHHSDLFLINHNLHLTMLNIKYCSKKFSYQKDIFRVVWNTELSAHRYSDLKHYYRHKNYSEVAHDLHSLSEVCLKQRHALVVHNSKLGLKVI